MRLYLSYIFLLLVLFSCSSKEEVSNSQQVSSIPNIQPDYIGVTVPSVIAPLNFSVDGTFELTDFVFSGKGSTKIHLQSSNTPEIPVNKWKDLLSENIGDSIKIEVSVKREKQWLSYLPFYIHVSADPIDESICYRLIAPGYEVYSKMGIYQRTLADFKQDAILENTLVTGSCVNCHSFKQTDPSYLTFHVRGDHGATFVATPDKEITAYSTKTDSTLSPSVYPYWHPSGDYIAYSNNMTRQTFHTRESERIEVFDFKSDVTVYNVKTNELITSPLLKTENFETFPSFSPDGKRLYFTCASPKDMPAEFRDIQYNLCAIDFNPETGSFGNHIDTLFYAEGMNKSVTFPRPSYDGRYIMFTLIDFGQFSIWHKEADLWMLDLATGEARPLDGMNSDDTESYHSWSSNSRWTVFSSRRGDGLYTRPYIAHINENGEADKAFLLPQKDPVNYYKELLFSYNIPEFSNAPFKLNIPEIEEQLMQVEKPSFSFKSN